MAKYPFAFNILRVILTFSLMQSITEAIQYYIPQLDYISTYIKQYESNFDQIVKYQINRAKIYEQYENGTLMITNVEGSKPYQIILFDSLNSKSLYNQFQLIDFSIDPWLVNEVHVLTNTNDIITFNISFNLDSSNLNDIRQKVDSCPVYQNSLLLNTNETFYIINPNSNNGSAVINRILRWYNLDENSTYFNFSDLDLTPNPIFTGIEGDEIRGTLCKKLFKIQQYLVLWNMSSYVQIYQCDYGECRLNGTIPNNFGNDSWVTDKINMGNQCNRIFIEYDDLAPAQTYNISGHSKSSYLVDQPIQQFKPIGGSSQEASILFPNNSYIIFSVVNDSFIAQYDDFGNVSEFTRFSWGWRELLMNYEDRIDIYKFQCFFGAGMIYFQWYRGECTNCSNTCTHCFQGNGTCTSCIPDYEIDSMNSKRCRPIIYPNITTNITTNITANISNPSSPINFNTTPSISNSTIIINVTTLEQNGTSRYKYGAQYEYEYIAAELTIESFDIIGKIIEVIFKIMQVLPLAWLLLNFINFWVICSFYVFLSVDIPQYLRIILKVIYDKINSPIIEMNFVADTIYPLPQKLSQLSSQFGISSSFLDMNFQSLLVFSFSTVIAGILALSIKYVPKKSWYYRNFADQIDFEEIVKSQFVSSTSNYFLPFALVLYKLNRNFWNEQPNLAIHLLFMGMSFAFPFLVIGKTNKKVKINKNSKPNKKLDNQTFKTIEWIYYSNCNTIVPFLCILEWPYIYLPFGFIFLSFGIWVAYHQDQFKINEIILASYRVLFHFFFTLVALFGRFSTPLKHHSSAICIGILFLGAVHELLTVFFRSVFFLYQQIIKIRKKVRDKPHFDLDSIKNTNPKENPIHRFSYKFQLSEDPIKQQKQKQKTKKIKVHRGNKPPMTQFQVKSVIQSLYEETFDCNSKKDGTNCMVQKQIKALTDLFQSLNQQPKSLGQQMTKRQAKKGNKIKVHKNKVNLLHLFQNKIQSQIDIHKMQEKPE